MRNVCRLNSNNSSSYSNKSIVESKSFNFAIRIVNLYKYLTDDKKEYVLSKQILKSGTSIGANIDDNQANSIMKSCIELEKMLTSIVKTTSTTIEN